MKQLITLSVAFLLVFGIRKAFAQTYPESMQSSSELQKTFLSPPDEARPRVWWHWMNGNITKEGIRKDLLWMQRAGIGGIHHFDAGLYTPQITEQKLDYMTPAWQEAFGYAVHLADSLGMELAVASAPGWSATGGPWVKPQDAMKKLTWREMILEGGKLFSGQLLAPYTETGPFLNVTAISSFPSGVEHSVPSYYKDIAVLAIRLSPKERSLKEMQAKVTSSGGQFNIQQLTDNDLQTFSSLPIDTTNGYAWIQYTFLEPQTIRAVSLAETRLRYNFEANPPECPNSLWASEDGILFKEVAKIPLGVERQTITIPPTTAKYFQVRIENPKEDDFFAFMGISNPAPLFTNVSEFILYTVPRINHSEEKTGFAAPHDMEQYPTPCTTTDDVTAIQDVIDLTDLVDETGHLTWNVPEGKWKVIRMGYSLIGKENHPAPPEATGLEVDKMNPEAWTTYFRHYLDMYREAAGGLLGQQGVQYILTDSYEAGSATWTPALADEFVRRRGYELLPWMPVLTGHIIGSTKESEQFLRDWRKTLGELLAENYDLLTTIVQQEYGMKGRYSESHENGRLYLVDGMDVKRTATVPMGALWAPGTVTAGPTETMSVADIRESASVAHIYGQNLVAAESMTAIGSEAQAWSYAPDNLKSTIDTEYANGLNRVVVHTSVHQPVDDKLPGLSMMVFGQWFNRHDTWAEQARAWTDYMARSSYLLQQGRFVADIVYYYGEDNTITGLFGHGLPAIPSGYEFDFINADALLRLLSVEDGCLKTPSGMQYRILVLDENARRMSLPVLRKIAALADAGAVICGQRPEIPIGRMDDTDEWYELVERTWASGRNNVSTGTINQTLERLNIGPDLSSDYSSQIRYVHRTLPDAEIYWVNKPDLENAKIEASFRVTGKRPQVWRPENGTVEEVSYSIENGYTRISLSLLPNDAVFIVFEEEARQISEQIPEHHDTLIARVDTPWSVEFQSKYDTANKVQFDSLISYTEHPDARIRYFSGTAIYRNTITLETSQLKGNGRLFLDLGEVKNLAEVFVNGRSLGILWKSPFITEATEALVAGENELEIRVTNLWVNRLIGDQQPEVQSRVTYSTFPFFHTDSPLLPSGLLGPVGILKREYEL